MAEDVDLALAVQRADELSVQWNGGRRCGVELFVRIGDIRIAIDPTDAALLDESVKARKVFHLDDRTAKSDRVFAETDSLPSGWYAETPTPEREEVAVPA